LLYNKYGEWLTVAKRMLAFRGAGGEHPRRTAPAGVSYIRSNQPKRFLFKKLLKKRHSLRKEPTNS
jgi:hypothetical protein